MYGFLPRRLDLSSAQFHQHWRTAHRDHALKINRIRRYVQSHWIADGVPGLRAAHYDGVAEIWYADLQSALGMGEDPDYTENAALDEPNFVDMDASGVVFTHTDVLFGRGLLAADTGAVKALLMVRRRAPDSPEQFGINWQAFAQDLKTALPDVIRTEVSLADGTLYGDGERAPAEEPVFDGFAAIWWPERTSFDDSWAEAGATVVERVKDLTDTESSVAGLYDELRGIWPPENSSE